MKKTFVFKRTWQLYRQNFGQLMLTLFVQLIIRAIALTPLMFLANKETAFLAWLAVPTYLLIVLPARQNLAIALQDMLHGGRVFTVRLISLENYFSKLWRGLKGTLCMLLWSAVTIAGIAWLALSITGSGGMDGFTLLRLFSSVGKIIGGKTREGAFLIIGGIAATSILTLVGCAVHCGSRHAHALGNKKLLKGRRMRLTGIWLAGFLLLLPFMAAVVGITGGWAIGLVKQFTNSMKLGSLALSNAHVYQLIAAAVVLLLPVIPFRTLLPAVYLHEAEVETDAAA